MNSTWKLLPAGLLLAVLAGCGGGGSGEMMEPTPEEQCSADGGIYEDGTCKSADDLRDEGAQEEGDKRDQEDADEQAAADAAAAQKMAANLIAVLMSNGDSTATPPVDDPSMIMRVDTGYDDADMKNSMIISVMGKKFSEEYDDASDATVSAVDTTTSMLTFVDDSTHMRVMGDAFSTGASKTHTHDKVRTVGGTTSTYFSTPGSYHGVMGTYECTSTACSSSIPANNQGLTLTGTWTFKPSNPDTPVTDADGLKYGWWATGTAGSVTAVHSFYVGDSLVKRTTALLPADHGGTATYKGGAMGQYAIHRGTGGMNDSGSFTANAELMATFGDAAKISGKIDGFMGSDGMARDWMVMLGELTVADNADTTNNVLSNTGNVVWTIGEDASAKAGGWEVATYGGTVPDAVAGGFQASHGIANGHMIGAFGADKE